MLQDQIELNRNFTISFIISVVFTLALLIYAGAMATFDRMGMEPELGKSQHFPAVAGLALTSLALLAVRERLSIMGARAMMTKDRGLARALAARHVIRASVNEAVGVLGVGNFLLTGNLGVSLAFLGVGLFALIRARPSKEEWRAVVTQRQG
mgnify:CR=1 FL=1